MDKIANEIIKMTMTLDVKYPFEGSRASVWGRAVRDKLVTQDLYDAARKYYGNLWNYCGD